MIIIDPHVHVWTSSPDYPWAIETENPPESDATPAMLRELMEKNGVHKTIIVQVIHYRWDNSYAAKALSDYPDLFMGVCRVNPEDPAAPDHLSHWTENFGFHGVRLSPASNAAGDWFTGELMDPLFHRAGELGVPVLILTKPARLADLASLADRHPDVDIVVDHMADCHPDDYAHRKSLLELSRFPRIYVKTQNKRLAG